MADRMFPARYQSDFAVQVTSQVSDAQQFTINFANNNLLGSGNLKPSLAARLSCTRFAETPVGAPLRVVRVAQRLLCGAEH